MFLVKDILQLIANEITDSRTWINLSMTCCLAQRHLQRVLKKYRISTLFTDIEWHELPGQSGKLHGKYREWYKQSGHLKYVTYYLNDQKHGPWKHYFPNGQPISAGIYKNNLIAYIDFLLVDPFEYLTPPTSIISGLKKK